MSRGACVAAAVALSVGLSGGAAARRARVPDSDLELLTKDGELFVRKGAARARLSIMAEDPSLHSEMVLGVEVRADGPNVRATVDVNCQGESRLTFTRAGLEARLENAAAARHAAHRRWDAAADGFARAVKLDPDLAEAATNLAAAQAKGGHEREAVATLSAAGARNRPWVIWRALVDRSLARAAVDPDVQKLWTRTPGRATLAALGRKHAAYSPELGVVIWNHAVGNMVSDSDEYDPSELRIADAATGKLVARLPYRAVSVATIGKALAAMGFETDAVQSADLRVAGSARWDLRGRVPGTTVAVVVKNARVRLTDGGRVVGEAPVAVHTDYASSWGWVARFPGGVLVGVDVNVGDGCGGAQYDDVVWLRGEATGR